jgi:hypothetical protein
VRSLPDSPRTQMATPATAMQLLEQLRAVSYPAAKQDYEELSAFADGQVCSLSLSLTWARGHARTQRPVLCRCKRWCFDEYHAISQEALQCASGSSNHACNNPLSA